MRLSNRQLIVMWDVLRASANVCNGMGGFSQATLIQLVNDILDQQSNYIVDLDEKEKEVT